MAVKREQIKAAVESGVSIHSRPFPDTRVTIVSNNAEHVLEVIDRIEEPNRPLDIYQFMTLTRAAVASMPYSADKEGVLKRELEGLLEEVKEALAIWP